MSQRENPFAGQGAVLLDIGGDVGALVVTMPAEMDGIEVEINRVDGRASDPPAHDRDHDHHDHDHDHDHDHHELPPGSGHRPHVAVVARPTPAGIVHSLVFPELTEGTYELYRRPAEPVELTVTVRGAAVTEAVWPGV